MSDEKCPECDGTGLLPAVFGHFSEPCGACNGSGIKWKPQPMKTVSDECPFGCGASLFKPQLWECGSNAFTCEPRQSDRCRIACLERDLAAVTAERDLLAALLEQGDYYEIGNALVSRLTELSEWDRYESRSDGERPVEKHPTAIAAIRAALKEQK